MRLINETHRKFREALEELFYRYGKFVASRPWPVIFTTFVATTLCSLGWLLFRIQYATDELWIPSTSEFKSNKAWKNDHFSKNTRYENILFKGENVLTPKTLQQMYLVHEEMVTYQTNGQTFADFCFKIPIEDLFYKGKNPRGVKNVRTNPPTVTQPPVVVETTTSGDEDDDYYDVFDDFYDYEEETESVETEPKTAVIEVKNETKEEKEEEERGSFLDGLPSDIYCDLVTTLDKRCYEQSILEIWDFDRDIIFNLTQADILDAINTLTVSPWFWSPKNYTDDLGGIERNATGHVVGAKAIWVQILVEVPEDAVKVDAGGIGFEFEVADENSLNFEQHLIDLSARETGKDDITIIVFTARSFNDVSFQTIFFDVWKMLGGYVIMFTFTVMMLGKLNKTEVRLYLSAAGMFSCILGLGAAFGIMFMLGMEYNQTHHILPFIAIGIGIDDMFVIMECWYNLLEENKGLPLPERIGQTMRHAGISVTVTSITDVMAFGLGAFTIMPGLQAFCVSAAICIALIFLLQTSWFVAWLSLDQHRIEMRKHGIIPCVTVEKESEPVSLVPEKPLAKRLMSRYASLLDSSFFKAAVLTITAGLLAFGIYGSVNIVQRFDPIRMLPRGNYLSEWIHTQNQYWPSYGLQVQVMTGPLVLEDLPRLDGMVAAFERVAQDGPDKILREVDSWWPRFKKFLEEDKNKTWQDLDTLDNFHLMLSDFLFDIENSKEQNQFKFNGTLVCSQPVPPIIAIQHQLFYGLSSSVPPPTEYLPAKALIDTIIEDANLSTVAFATSPIYEAWETDKIISVELWRNLSLCLIAVAAISLILLGDFRLTVMVVTCILATLVDLIGTLHFWDVTIDVIVCVNIVLACGLCVDYSVHIAHSFSVAEGTRTERAQNALVTLGPAIVNAGITTLLAVIILPFSASHVFITFFKVFGLTVLYGVFHGLAFLPTILATLGSNNQALPPSTPTSPKTPHINPVFIK